MTVGGVILVIPYSSMLTGVSEPRASSHPSQIGIFV
jgi:hypothetical protein